MRVVLELIDDVQAVVFYPSSLTEEAQLVDALQTGKLVIDTREIPKEPLDE